MVDACKEFQYDFQKGLCCWCGKKMHLFSHYSGSPMYATWEHIIPLSCGGGNVLVNKVLACKKCNNKRADYLKRPPSLSYRHWHPNQDENRAKYEKQLLKLFGSDAVDDLYRRFPRK